jgi:CRP-like cAMP-binding protein
VKHTIVDKARMLRGVPLLSQVSTEVLADLAALSSVEQHPAGTVLYRTGEPATAFYIVIEGEVRTAPDGEEGIRVGPGGELGALAVLDERPRAVTAETASDSVLLHISAEDFLYLLEQHPRLARGVIRYLAREARASLAVRRRYGADLTGPIR